MKRQYPILEKILAAEANSFSIKRIGQVMYEESEADEGTEGYQTPDDLYLLDLKKAMLTSLNEKDFLSILSDKIGAKLISIDALLKVTDSVDTYEVNYVFTFEEPLTEDQKKEVTKVWDAQLSDGWGEGFEQSDYAVDQETGIALYFKPWLKA